MNNLEIPMNTMSETQEKKTRNSRPNSRRGNRKKKNNKIILSDAELKKLKCIDLQVEERILQVQLYIIDLYILVSRKLKFVINVVYDIYLFDHHFGTYL